MIYYKYNPINFEQSVVTKLINEYIGKNYKLIELQFNIFYFYVIIVYIY